MKDNTLMYTPVRFLTEEQRKRKNYLRKELRKRQKEYEKELKHEGYDIVYGDM